jgi:hypothetical integral membrane protein (TIGR02206 family)
LAEHVAAFQPFGPSHWWVLTLTVGIAVALLMSVRRLRRVPDDRWVRVGLACGLVGNEVVSWVYAITNGYWGLPLQLCDLAVFLVAWALVGERQLVKELAFFWGLAGSSQAVLTPDLLEEFPSYPWFQFFLGHGGVVLSAVYLAVRGRVQLTAGSVWRVWIISNAYVVVAMLVNWRLGTNFGYLARKPEHPSLLDYLGPWPLYILWVEVIALVLFFLCLGLSRAIDRIAGDVSHA